MTRSGKSIRRLLGGRTGNAMLEFAIGATVLVTVVLSAFQYGYIFYQYNALTNSVRNAALFGAAYPYLTSCNTPDATWLLRTKNVAVYGNAAGTGSALLPGLTTGNIQYNVDSVGVCGSGGGIGTFRPTEVTIFVSGYTINGLFGNYVTSNKPQASYPYHGYYDP